MFKATASSHQKKYGTALDHFWQDEVGLDYRLWFKRLPNPDWLNIFQSEDFVRSKKQYSLPVHRKNVFPSKACLDAVDLNNNPSF
jgi:hypothetical protein